jgi:two-component sensor histidine kinase
MAHRYEIQVYTKDGDLRWTEQFVSPILYRGRPALQIAVTDITERKKAQAELAASLQQKEVLLREVHHRVKNNLAVAASMLGLQTLESDDPNLEAVLARSQERLYAMGRVHEHLYRTRDLRAVDMRDYLSGLVTHLQHSLGRPDIELVFDVDDVKLDLDTASPCGLIVNELVTNAFKHAFPETAPREGQAQYKIHVSLQREGDSLTLTVRDNGVGLKPDALAAPSLGIQLVQLLTSNLNGTFRAKVLPDRPSGATFTVRFNAGEITP